MLPRTAIVLGILLAASALGETSLPATDVTAASIDAFLKALPREEISDKPIRVVDVGGYHVGVYGVYRPKDKPGEAIIHETKVTEVYQMLSGNATLVTGGTIAESHRQGTPGHMSVRGPRIENGVSRHVGKGDVIIIPGGTPHWFSSLDSDITYLIIRPDPGSTIQLK